MYTLHEDVYIYHVLIRGIYTCFVAESAAPLHVACGHVQQVWGEPAVRAAGAHSLQLCVGGLSCSCEGVCEQWRL